MQRMLELLQIARFNLTRKFPYLSRLLFSLSINTKPSTLPHPTACVDQWGRVYWDRRLVERFERGELGLGDLEFILAHEALHIFKLHFMRRGGREPERWNISGDLEINDDLAQMSLSTSLPVLFPSTYELPDHLSAEEYYDLLPQQVGKGGKKRQQGEQNEQGNGQGNGDSDEGWQPVSGSAADGIRREWEQDGVGGDPERGIGEGYGEEKWSRIVREVARDVEEWVRQKGVGSVPAGVERMVKELLREKGVDWRKVLRDYLTRTRGRVVEGEEVETWQYPNRRSGVVKDIVPPWRASRMPAVGVVVDTSGSIGDEDLGLFLSEVLKMAGGLGMDVWLGFGDVILYEDTVVKMRGFVPPKTLKIKGGGGTDMGGVASQMVTHLMKRGVTVDLLIVLTDGYTPWDGFNQIKIPAVVAIVSDSRDEFERVKPPKMRNITSVLIERRKKE